MDLFIHDLNEITESDIIGPKRAESLGIKYEDGKPQYSDEITAERIIQDIVNGTPDPLHDALEQISSEFSGEY
jgi:hypothetical protein